MRSLRRVLMLGPCSQLVGQPDLVAGNARPFNDLTNPTLLTSDLWVLQKMSPDSRYGHVGPMEKTNTAERTFYTDTASGACRSDSGRAAMHIGTSASGSGPEGGLT